MGQNASTIKPTIVHTGRPFTKVLLLLVGFSSSVLLRILIGGSEVATSVIAGIVFAVSLILLSKTEYIKSHWTIQTVGWGLLGATVLFLPIALLHLSAGQLHSRPAGNYVTWSIVVSVVAAAEEYFLRGALYQSVERWKGDATAVLLGAIAFAALHIPLYGWQIVPLDFVAGLWLGTLRNSSGSWLAPGITHILADLGAWWIV
jgi:membrane protease YdiL (CAAX protease family)